MAEYLILATQICGGLLAGVYLAFAIAVMPALGDTSDRTYVEVMNKISQAIVNPVFLILFLGAPGLSLAILLVERSPLTFANAALGLITLVVTFAAHFPLNNELAAFADHGGVEAVRAHVAKPWNQWHLVRTVTGTGSFICLLLL